MIFKAKRLRSFRFLLLLRLIFVKKYDKMKYNKTIGSKRK